MSQIMMLDRLTTNRVRAKKISRLIVIITSMKLRFFELQVTPAETEKQHRIIRRPEPCTPDLKYAHLDPFLQRIDR